MIYTFDIGENIVRKGENPGHQHFSPFATMFSIAVCFIVDKTWDLMN